MDDLSGLGAFVWFVGLVVLLLNTVADSGTPMVTHIDVLGLGMTVSGAILACGSRSVVRAGADAK